MTYRMQHFSNMRCIVSNNAVYAKYLQISFEIWRYFCLRERWDSKGRPCRRQGNKVSGGHFVSPWESPSKSRCIQYGCRWILNMSDFEKVLVRAHFFEGPIRTLAPKIGLSLTGWPNFYCLDGTRTI